MGESGVTERLEGVDERDSPSVVDVTLRVSGAFGSIGAEAAPPSSLLPSPPPERWEPMEMIKPVLVNPTRFAATLEMNVSRTTTSCLTNLSRNTLSGSALGHIAA